MVVGCLARRRRKVLVRRWALVPGGDLGGCLRPRRRRRRVNWQTDGRPLCLARLTTGSRGMTGWLYTEPGSRPASPRAKPQPGLGHSSSRTLRAALTGARHCTGSAAERISYPDSPPGAFSPSRNESGSPRRPRRRAAVVQPNQGSRTASAAWHSTPQTTTASFRPHTMMIRTRRRRRRATRAPRCCGRPCSARAAGCCSSRSIAIRHRPRRRARRGLAQSTINAPARRRSACWPRRG